MSGKNAVEAADFGMLEPKDGKESGTKVPLHMSRPARVRLYRVMSGVLEAGLDFDTAIKIVGGEYQSDADASGASKSKADAEIVTGFLSGLSRIRKDGDNSPFGPEIPDLVAKLFGRDFVEAEEMAILRAMKTADNLAAAFRAAAELALMGRRQG